MIRKNIAQFALIAALSASSLPALAQSPVCVPGVDYASQGRQQYNSGQLEAAQRSFECALASDSENARLHLAYGMVVCAMGRPDEAAEHYARAIELDPEYAMAYNNLGWANYRLGKLDVALESLDTAITLDPNLAYAYNNRGLVMQQRGLLAEAIRDFEQAIALGLKQPWAEINLYNARYEQQTLAAR